MRKPEHQAVIEGMYGGCTCRQWFTRAAETETSGQFTSRAALEHSRHVERVTAARFDGSSAGLFAVEAEPEPETDQPGLF